MADSIDSNNNLFLYIPDPCEYKPGCTIPKNEERFSFRGLECPSKKVVEILGLDRIENLANHIRQLVQNRIELFGESSALSKFHSPCLEFMSKEDPTLRIICSAMISPPFMVDGKLTDISTCEYEISDDYVKEWYHYPDRLVSGSDNYCIDIDPCES